MPEVAVRAIALQTGQADSTTWPLAPGVLLSVPAQTHAPFRGQAERISYPPGRIALKPCSTAARTKLSQGGAAGDRDTRRCAHRTARGRHRCPPSSTRRAPGAVAHHVTQQRSPGCGNASCTPPGSAVAVMAAATSRAAWQIEGLSPQERRGPVLPVLLGFGYARGHPSRHVRCQHSRW